MYFFMPHVSHGGANNGKARERHPVEAVRDNATRRLVTIDRRRPALLRVARTEVDSKDHAAMRWHEQKKKYPFRMSEYSSGSL